MLRMLDKSDAARAIALGVVLLALVISLFLSSCAPQPVVREGSVTAKRHTQETTSNSAVPVIIGKIVTIIPIRQTLPESWQVHIWDGDLDSWITVTQQEFECLSEGDYVILNGSSLCGGTNGQ